MTVSTTSASPDAREVWRRARVPLGIALALVALAVLSTLLTGGEGGELDPRSVKEGGSRAVARLLDGEGVEVEPAGSATEATEALGALGGAATLLVTHPDRVLPEELARLTGRAGDVVLLRPGPDALAAVAERVRFAGPTEDRHRAPGCELPAARAAGPLTLGGLAYGTGDSGTGDSAVVTVCYGGVLARAATVTVLGDVAPLTNAALADEGNAALAMRLLGQHPRLVWYQPAPGDAALRGGGESIYDLVPRGWYFGLGQVAVAVLLLALWRARRLGPVVVEPLPVVVRGAETVEGRARLYRRAGAAEHAATALRDAARQRMLPALGLTAEAAAEPAVVVAAVAARTGRSEAEVGALLYGGLTGGEAQLVERADALDALEREVLQ
ncbi:hypothetical protein SAMN05421810_10532 [Amycolatopsis arida]|uniref:DUF4350 domain-containing protein n=1 Tax=Amycolatopsis arida TaxID=587909 RepID=A0A1I5WBR6_9PSEU|nr:DUF4350 domain-containing protein [Amycolatopsis arida]TDX92206.1 hypothetical protein CLV69_10551 [Amycolatopsis arida]SFQ17173.1 hypothetical protein SAMN05421810_10532 [Amycolatopsis arida]